MSIAAEVDVQSSWRPGATLAGFRLMTPIARGTTAEVWLAKIMGAEGFEKTIALKTMRASTVGSPVAVQMFTGEAAITARLYHPNIVQLVDCGRIADRYYIAMEFVDGMTLRQAANRFKELGQPIPLPLVAHIGIQICAALHYTHELTDQGATGFLHRDVELENILLTHSGAVKVIDFGAARARATGGAVIPFNGKLRYAAPEVVQGTPEDHRCDIYSLGTTLYELITGIPPYQGDSLRLVSRIVEGKPRTPHALAPGLPEALSAIVLKAMARRPEDRYPTAASLSAALRMFLESDPAYQERTPSLTGVLRTLFQGAAGSFWRGALAGSPPARERLATRPTTATAPPTTCEPSGDGLDDHEEVTPSWMVLLEDEPNDLKAENTVPEDLSGIARRNEEPPARVDDRDEPSSRQWKPPVWPFESPPSDSTPAPASRVFATSMRQSNPPSLGGPDFFSVRRGDGVIDPVASWNRSISVDPAPVVAETASRPIEREIRQASVESSEAARCFDRGLAFISDRLYGRALAEWNRAIELEPENRLYLTNLKRLRAHLDQSPAETTETQ